MGLLGTAIIAPVVAVIAGALGFSGIAVGAATVARIVFGLFLIVAVVLFVISRCQPSLLRRRGRLRNPQTPKRR
jgi:uncharacterized membrane protein YtjA (UPF0391 family)